MMEQVLPECHTEGMSINSLELGCDSDCFYITKFGMIIVFRNR